jgi:hypothetical protein
MPKLVWRVKLVAELRPGEVTATEVARIERDEQAGEQGVLPRGVRLLVRRCAGSRPTAADLPLSVPGWGKSFSALDLVNDAIAPEPAYVAARYAALAPFAKVAVLLSELLPMSGAQNAGTVRNRTQRVGETVVQQHDTEAAKPTAMSPATSVVPGVVGLDGGYGRKPDRRLRVGRRRTDDGKP